MPAKLQLMAFTLVVLTCQVATLREGGEEAFASFAPSHSEPLETVPPVARGEGSHSGSQQARGESSQSGPLKAAPGAARGESSQSGSQQARGESSQSGPLKAAPGAARGESSQSGSQKARGESSQSGPLEAAPPVARGEGSQSGSQKARGESSQSGPLEAAPGAARGEDLHTAALLHHPLYDYRGNFFETALAESLWAARTLRQTGFPNPKLSEFWPGVKPGKERTMIEMMQEWSRRAMRLELPVVQGPDLIGNMDDDAAALLRAGVAHHQAVNFAYEVVQGLSNLKGKLDDTAILRVRAGAPGRGSSCQVTSARERCSSTRKQRIFKARGREEINETLLPQDDEATLSRNRSWVNRDAGIVALAWAFDELRDFFPQDVWHSKNAFQRADKGETDSDFEAEGVPFIGGASGSILYMILLMEDASKKGMPSGTVPCGHENLKKPSMMETLCGSVEFCPDRRAREALIGFMTAILIAAGHHSLGECLIVAQSLGYFVGIPSFITDSAKVSYADASALFEEHLDKLGLTGSGGVLAANRNAKAQGGHPGE